MGGDRIGWNSHKPLMGRGLRLVARRPPHRWISAQQHPATGEVLHPLARGVLFWLPCGDFHPAGAGSREPAPIRAKPRWRRAFTSDAGAGEPAWQSLAASDPDRLRTLYNGPADQEAEEGEHRGEGANEDGATGEGKRDE